MTRSTFPDVEIPELSIYDFLFGGLTPDDLDVTALVDGTSGAKTSYGELLAQINAVAGALAARGVNTETTIGLLCPNAPAFAVVFHGILRAGAVVTTINSLYTA
jgi:acyl-CoA synthetase (AMP-forming)/AMP-acid ligase II